VSQPPLYDGRAALLVLLQTVEKTGRFDVVLAPLAQQKAIKAVREINDPRQKEAKVDPSRPKTVIEGAQRTPAAQKKRRVNSRTVTLIAKTNTKPLIWGSEAFHRIRC
jgi:ribosomal protein L7/L12